MLVVISCLVALISLNGVWAEDVDFTGRIVVSALHIQYLGERANWEKALSSAIAIESSASYGDDFKLRTLIFLFFQ